MAKKSINTVDEYIASLNRWQDEIARLREIVGSAGLEETIKWGAPAYTAPDPDGKPVNVVGIVAFKAHFALWFHQGALLTDPDRHLTITEGGKAKAMREWRFESPRDIKPRPIKAYVKEAAALAAQGQAIKPERRGELVEVPPELAEALKSRAKTRKAFEALTPGKRREYAAHIAEAKREATKQTRIEKILPMIEAGVGLHDKYKNC
ncbi:MAG: YdeI/OmpD-associated family protein [Phycisphaerales bacterium]